MARHVTLLSVGKTLRDGMLRMGEELRDRSNNGTGLPSSLGNVSILIYADQLRNTT